MLHKSMNFLRLCASLALWHSVSKSDTVVFLIGESEKSRQFFSFLCKFFSSRCTSVGDMSISERLLYFPTMDRLEGAAARDSTPVYRPAYLHERAARNELAEFSDKTRHLSHERNTADC